MGYDYYCMHCGKQLNQKSVLFDMQYVLTGDDKREFSILKFRLLESELNAILARGTAAEGGYHWCELRFAEVMQYIANGNNLNDQAIAGLTLEEVNAFRDAEILAPKAAKKTDAEFDAFSEDIDEEPAEEQEEKAPAYTPSAAVEAIEGKDQSNTNIVETKYMLGRDFELLQGTFGKDETIRFQLKEIVESDNEGKPVLNGYSFQLANSNYIAVERARICPGCGTRVFKHAGTAKHQAVAFIGYQSAGKTSTILALTNYALNHMLVDLGELGVANAQLWAGAEVINTAASVELLDPSAHLTKNLSDYNNGFAPEKTDADSRDKAYSATFRIKNKVENKYYLFTLTDLPGELCNKDGTIDRNNVENSFSVALSCDAFVACFDSSSIDPTGAGITSWISNVCQWTSEFQQMRAERSGVNTFVPTMLLFTKCKDLENAEQAPAPAQRSLPFDEMYMLNDEKRGIAGNRLYNFVCEQFNEHIQLNKAYHAMMRCSPYGYPAITEAALDKHPDYDNSLRPTPKNIDRLMRWLLSVSGCIPTEAKYQRINAAAPVRLNNYCISRPQLRSQNPLEGALLQESMARCALFENPGKFDKSIVGTYDSAAAKIVVKLDMKLHPNGNAN